MWTYEKLTKTTVLPKRQKTQSEGYCTHNRNDVGKAYHKTVTKAKSGSRKKKKAIETYREAFCKLNERDHCSHINDSDLRKASEHVRYAPHLILSET